MMASQDRSFNDTETEQARIGPRYETRDVRLSAVAWLVFSIFLLTVLSLPGLFYLLGVYRSRAEGRDPRVSPLRDPDQIPPQPRLQSSPTADYEMFLESQNNQLASYGWIDKERGRVRIPVARARELILERGLPETKSAESAETTPPAADEPEKQP